MTSSAPSSASLLLIALMSRNWTTGPDCGTMSYDGTGLQLFLICLSLGCMLLVYVPQ